MRHYELVVVLSPMLNQEQSVGAWGRIKDFIGNQGGDIVHEETWGTRRLAYAIKKGPHHFLEGSYYLTRFAADVPFNQELLTFLRLDEQVLRSLVTVTGPPGATPQPSPMARVPVAAAPPEPAPAPTEEATPEEATPEAAPAAEPAPAAAPAEAAPATEPAETATAVAVAEAPPTTTEEPAQESDGGEQTQA